ncbi:uncharacterized protein LOC118262620 [Spodoptera frugiperda]|uniref:Uncharacterized protein LOC118262620 n=1 Tax=Spodoptera frugiperda TaxID=7108 RepID=A0A9R0CUY8_SPOFR|nr:uncharacterized protein LOC118262620 [Spodoptera frugiperda]
MKSKSFDLKLNTNEKKSLDRTAEFAGFYKSAAETNKLGAEKRKSDGVVTKENTKTKTGNVKPETPIKNKKRNKQELIDISQINIDGSTLGGTSFPRASSVHDIKTSTPNSNGKVHDQGGKVKSIMKNKPPVEQSPDSARSHVSSGKPKKRNKSVSFMLDDHEEVVVKRTKSDDSKINQNLESNATIVKDRNKNVKKIKKHQQSEKENKAAEVNNLNMEVENSKVALDKKSNKFNKVKKIVEASPAGDAMNVTQEIKEKKKIKKAKKQNSQQTDTEVHNSEVPAEVKTKKVKKTKTKSPPAETTQAEGEPAPKSRKKDGNPDIAEDLENLSIGDNAHTLSNLLDEMTVVDKDKRKILRKKFNKNKKPKGSQSSKKDDAEKPEEVKEKIKWKKRKWNKDKKGESNEDGLSNTLLVENLPLSMMLNYKKILTEHFIKHGAIKKIGIAEVYPTEESRPVFTTTISFQNDSSAVQALEENNSYLEGSRIQVKRPLPATQTTVVVRSYAELTDQAICTTFLGAGRIRSIRHLVKGKKSMATAFVEFDGPSAVERAIKLAGDTKIGGKKIHLSKFEIRAKKAKKEKNEADSAADADSEDSND